MRTLRAEWAKLTSVRAWVATLAAAAGLTVLIGLAGASGSTLDHGLGATPPTGPGGTLVTDDFHFVHQTLTGDGTVTARVVTHTGTGNPRPEWAKAGIMVRASLRPGASYAALMLTPGHGVRLQADYATDLAGSTVPGAPHWLRLTRSGDVITGYESVDGVSWRETGRVRPRDLPASAEVGMFVASPMANRTNRGFGGSDSGSFPTTGTARFDNVAVSGTSSGDWRGEDVGRPDEPGSSEVVGTTATVTGSGDLAPLPPEADAARTVLSGAFVGTLALVAVAVLFMTSELRRGLIRLTFSANPRRGQVLAAKTAVLGGAAFAAALVGSALAYLLGRPVLRANGFTPPAVPDESIMDPLVLRAIVGTAAVMALVAVLSLAVATILRSTAAAIAVVVAVVVLPQLIASGLPVSAGQWLMRATPAAGFAIQRTTPTYHQVTSICLPEDGCFLTNPWIGVAVAAAYAAVALLAAYWLLLRRDP